MFIHEVRYPFTKSLTFKIIIANAIVWFLQLATYPLINDYFALEPSLALSGYFYQFFTYMFLHAIHPYHIAINMLLLAIFGFTLEQTLGQKRFLTVYLVSGIGSAVFYIFMMTLLFGSSSASLLGASGAVFGVLAAYAFKYPKTWVYFFGLIPMPAIGMIIFFLVEESIFGLMSLQPGVANFGHVGGIVSGLLMMTYWKLTERESKFGDKDFEFVWE